MQNFIAILFALIIGFLGGYLIPYGSDSKESKEVETHTHSETLDLSSNALVPSIDLIVHKDPKSGWNAQVMLENFTFAPERASTEHVSGEGHAHIYVNDEKINRIYGEWYHLGKLGEGMNEVSVRLSTNDHKELTLNGELISDVEIVHVETTTMDEMNMKEDHGDMEDDEDHSHEEE